MIESKPSSYQLAILAALQWRPMYFGTVSQKVIAKRRALGKRQRASRKANR